MGASKPAAKRKKVDVTEGFSGDLIIEDTLENMLGKSIADSKDIIVEVKKERRINAALMVDTSLSMTGRKLAWAAVSAAVLAKRISLKDISVIAFESTANILKHIGKSERLERLIERILNVYATGYTNIEDGLKKGLYQLRLGTQPEKIGIIITDGKYTEGGDPLDLASKYKKLYVLMTKDYNSDERLCRKMASQGGGQVYTITQYEEIPYRLYRILNEILK
jgi:Mg-chelatase subunit ChlD